MNPWFGRFLDGLEATGDLTPEEAGLILEVASAAARSAGARQFAPMATYLAGRVAATAGEAARLDVLRRAVAAATAAGTAVEPLGLD